MKRKLVFTKKFPFVGVKKIEERHKYWQSDILHEELEKATKEQWAAIHLYHALKQLENDKKCLSLVSNYKFAKSYDGEYEFGEVAIKVTDGDDKNNDIILILQNKSRKEKREVLEIMKRVFEEIVSDDEKYIKSLRQGIANN